MVKLDAIRVPPQIDRPLTDGLKVNSVCAFAQSSAQIGSLSQPQPGHPAWSPSGAVLAGCFATKCGGTGVLSGYPSPLLSSRAPQLTSEHRIFVCRPDVRSPMMESHRDPKHSKTLAPQSFTPPLLSTRFKRSTVRRIINGHGSKDRPTTTLLSLNVVEADIHPELASEHNCRIRNHRTCTR